jgi:chromosome partitioning protein
MLNRKGGVGKTSSVFHLGGMFADRGYRTLLVDMDPQASLSSMLGVKAALALGKKDTVAGLFDPQFDPAPKEIIRATGWANLDLAPCCSDLNDYNLPRPETYPEWQAVLGHFLQEVRSAYDIILIDCPPNLNLASWNALMASHFVVIPLQCEDYGAQGIVHALQFVEQAKRHGNPKLTLLGFLLTMVARLSIHRAYQQEIRKLYGKDVLNGKVPYLTAFKEAISYGQYVNRYAPDSDAAKAINKVADEVLARVLERQNTTTLEVV